MDAYKIPTLDAKTLLENQGDYTLLDVRRPRAASASGEQLVGSAWIDPESLTLADPRFQTGKPLAIYCVHGHEVGTYATAMALVAGHEAHLVTGGFEALKAAGADLTEFASKSWGAS